MRTDEEGDEAQVRELAPMLFVLRWLIGFAVEV